MKKHYVFMVTLCEFSIEANSLDEATKIGKVELEETVRGMHICPSIINSIHGICFRPRKGQNRTVSKLMYIERPARELMN